MKLLKRIIAPFIKQDDPGPDCQFRVELTGEPPVNHSERLITEIVGAKRSVRLDWLEEQICNRLYRTELLAGGSVVDIGLWGPALFTREAARVLSEVRPGFARLVSRNETGLGAETNETESGLTETPERVYVSGTKLKRGQIG